MDLAPLSNRVGICTQRILRLASVVSKLLLRLRMESLGKSTKPRCLKAGYRSWTRVHGHYHPWNASVYMEHSEADASVKGGSICARTYRILY